MKTLCDGVLYEWTYTPDTRFCGGIGKEQKERGYFAGRYGVNGWPVMRTESEPVGYMLADPEKIKEV